MRNYRLYLEDIAEAIKNINKYTKDLAFGNFKKNNWLLTV